MAYDPTQFGQNPFIAQQAQNIQNQSNQNLAQNVMPGIGQGATAAGQYGGSRQGIAQGVAAGNAQMGVNSAIGNLYSNAYNSDQSAALQNRGLDLQNKSLDQSLFLGNQANTTQNKSLDNSFYLGNQGQMQNFYTAQRGQDQSGMALGANLYNMGNLGNLGIGTGQTALGEQYQNAPISALQQYSNTISPYSGLGGTQTTTGTSGGGAMGALGGALAGAQIGSNLNLGMGSTSQQDYGLQSGYSLSPNYVSGGR